MIGEGSIPQSQGEIVVERIRVLLLIPRLGTGGAEQVMALVAKGLSREKFEVHLGLVTACDAVTDRLPSWLKVYALGATRARAGAFGLLELVWQIRPDVILSGAAQISFLTLLVRPLFPPKTRVLVRQNGTVSSALRFGSVPGYTRLLYRLLYRRADKVICQSGAMAEDLARELGMDSKQISVLANPVDLEGIRSAMEKPVGRADAGPHLLAVGRLTWEKGFDLLLRAFAAVPKRFPHADLTIAGAGQEEAELKTLCKRLGLEDRVKFAGHVSHVYALFPGATVFVLSSRYEGMPNALLEAAAAGLPLVATPASGGIVELLGSGRGSWLADEITAEALGTAMIGALEKILPGERFCHAFFPSAHAQATKAVSYGAE